MISFCLIGGGIVDAPQGVQTAGITDKGQALGDDLDQESLIISDPHVGGGVAGELRLAASLSREEAERIAMAISPF